MRKMKSYKGIPIIVVGILLLISAFVFPSVAENIQTKGIEKAGKDLKVNFPKITEMVIEKSVAETNKENNITMSEEEEKVFDEIVLLLQKSTLLIAPQNRELSETESSRMIELRKKFRTGMIKSKKTLPIGENLKKPYYNPENETYYYPEIEMTEEELLQIIDFDVKLDKAFSKFYEAYIQNAMENTDIKISEEEAIKSAKNTIERIFDVDLENMDINCHFSIDEYRNERFWRIIFQPKNIDILIEQEKLYWMYFSKVNIYTGKVEYVDTFYSGQVEEVGNSPVTDLKNIDNHKEIAEEFLKNKLNGKNIEFLKAYIPKHSKAPLLSRKVYLVYKAEDKYIEFEFIYGSKRMMALFFHDDPIKLNERINEMEQESIGYITTNKITVLEDNGRRIPANSQILQLKDGVRIITLEGQIKYEPENRFFKQQKRISNEIFDNAGMRIEFKVGALKYEPRDKIDITKTKVDIVKKYPFEGNLKELKTEEILPYKLVKGIFSAQSEKDFEAEFYLENGQYGGKVDSEYNHDTRQYELDTKISGIEYYLAVMKNKSDEAVIDIKYNVSN